MQTNVQVGSRLLNIESASQSIQSSNCQFSGWSDHSHSISTRASHSMAFDYAAYNTRYDDLRIEETRYIRSPSSSAFSSFSADSSYSTISRDSLNLSYYVPIPSTSSFYEPASAFTHSGRFFSSTQELFGLQQPLENNDYSPFGLIRPVDYGETSSALTSQHPPRTPSQQAPAESLISYSPPRKHAFAPRAKISPLQRAHLERFFSDTHYPSHREIDQLALDLDLVRLLEMPAVFTFRDERAQPYKTVVWCDDSTGDVVLLIRSLSWFNNRRQKPF